MLPAVFFTLASLTNANHTPHRHRSTTIKAFPARRDEFQVSLSVPLASYPASFLPLPPSPPRVLCCMLGGGSLLALQGGVGATTYST